MQMNDHETCPICRNSAGHYTEKSGHHIYVCPVCDIGFVSPIPAKNELARLYSESYFHNKGNGSCGYTDYDRDKEPMRKVFEHYLEKLEQLTNKGKRNIFDIGAATGYFLDMARARGWNTFGSEISDYARDEATSRGHRMFRADVAPAELPEKMHAITMWDVLEHVPDPQTTLYSANQFLVHNGVIAINTVDRTSLWARLLGPHWHLMIPPEHLNYFSPKSLDMALHNAGFQMIEVKKIGKSFSLSYIFKTLGNWQRFECWNMLARMTDHPAWRWVSLPINLRDNVFVLARKIRDV